MTLNKLPDLIIKHQNIEENELQVWNLTPFIYLGGSKVRRVGDWLSKVSKLPIILERIKTIQIVKEHVVGMLNSGTSYRTTKSLLNQLKTFIQFVDEHNKDLTTPGTIEKTLHDYAEYQYTRYTHKEIKMISAYVNTSFIHTLFSGAFENVKFSMSHARLKKVVQSQRAISRKADKVMLGDASKLASFCFDIANNFKPESLSQNILPIMVKVRDELLTGPVNLTPYQKKIVTTDKSFFYTEAAQAFNNRVAAESMIFLAMTLQNVSPAYNLRIEKFNFKPIGEKYEVRGFKDRRGGEILFKIPKPYRPHFERYLDFIHKYAPKSKWIFPFLKKGIGYTKRNDHVINNFKMICNKYQIPWTPLGQFRKIGENVLMRLCSDEQTAADYVNHGIATFRQSYELPSLQRAIIEVGRFWDKNDPLTHGAPKISLFNTPCIGIPEEIANLTNKLTKPDCITPTGCIGCMHYRDEESLDYVWNLHSFKYLKIIESSSHQTKEEKPSNIAIDWANIKINWFKNSKKSEHREWAEEAKIRIQEGYYHSIWSRKIEKYEG